MVAAIPSTRTSVARRMDPSIEVRSARVPGLLNHTNPLRSAYNTAPLQVALDAMAERKRSEEYWLRVAQLAPDDAYLSCKFTF